MIFSPVVISLYESDSLASYVKYGSYSCFINAFRVSKRSKEGLRLQLDSITEPLNERLYSFDITHFENHTIILEVSPNSLLKRIREIEELIQNHRNLFEVNIRLEYGITQNVNITNLLKQLDECINLINQHDNVKKVIFFTFSLSCNNYYLADDLMQLFIDRKIDRKLFFIPEKSVGKMGKSKDTNRVNYSLFGVMIFLESLARSKKHNLAKRLFYNRLIGLIDKGDTEGYVLQKVITPKISELFSLSVATLKGKLNHLFSQKKENHSRATNASEPTLSNPENWRHVLVTGWYGTETNGDKAILAEVIYFLRSCSPECKITITTLCQSISIQTNIELNCTEYVDLVDINLANHRSVIEEVDAVIIGGGPLMESSAMANLELIFDEANKQKKARIIFGCGIGPIHTDKIRLITRRLVALSTAGFLRDEESYKYATQLFPGHKLKWACDPAFGYINRWRYSTAIVKENNGQLKIAGLLRANTNEFRNELDKGQLDNANEIAANQIAGIIEPVCCENNANLELLHMNAPWIGGDDRIFNRKIERSFKEANRVKCVREYLTLEEHLLKLHSADVSVAMRYHGHIFSMALGIPFLSINYTGKGGKVGSLIERIGYNEWTVPWAEMDVAKSSKQLQDLIEDRVNLSSYLLVQTNILTEMLYRTYQDVFGVEINRKA